MFESLEIYFLSTFSTGYEPVDEKIYYSGNLVYTNNEIALHCLHLLFYIKVHHHKSDNGK